LARAIRSRPRAPPLLLRRHQRDLDVVARVEVLLRRLLDRGAGQGADLVRQGARVRDVAVRVAAGDLVEEVAIVLAVQLVLPQEALADPSELLPRDVAPLERSDFLEDALREGRYAGGIARPLDPHAVFRLRELHR